MAVCNCGYSLVEPCPRCGLMRCKVCKKPKEILGAAVDIDYRPCSCTLADDIARFSGGGRERGHNEMS